MSDGNGQRSAPVRRRHAVLVAYLVLQLAGSLLLGLAFGVGRLLAPLLAGQVELFTASWTAVFVLVPVSFVPALWWWHAWVVRRFGNRPRTWRFVAEAAFALQVVGTLALLGIV